MIIGGSDLGHRRLLIAEIGNNHEGDASAALEMVSEAAEAGVDAVKVQVVNPDKLVNRSQKERVAQLSRFRLPFETFAQMAELARARGLLFFASAFDDESLDRIAPLLDAVKIASGDLDFGILLSRAAKLNKPIMLSTGMSTMDEVAAAVSIIRDNIAEGRQLHEMLALLHCVSLYPAPLAQANLRGIQTLWDRFGLTVGYSDHTLGIEAAVVSLGLGARIIEKHFTLDKNRSSFRDHALSADPAEMRRLAAVTHAFDEMLGSGEKAPSAEEQQTAASARRSIVAARDLAAGRRLSLDDFDYVRPRNGLPPKAAQNLVGRKLRMALSAHDPVLESHVE